MSWKGVAVATSALALVGCAITPEQASRRSSFELCEMVYRGGGTDTHRYNLQRELSNRRYDCRGDYPAIAAKIQAESALFLGLMGAAAALQPPPPRTCVANSLGTSTVMTCN